MLRNLSIGLLALALAGCAAIGLQSVPWPASVPIVDENTALLYRNAPKSKPLGKTDYQNDNLIMGLSVSGGGSRATAFTVGVLIGLEEIKKPSDNHYSPHANALEAVDFASATSGGAWGIVAYIGDRLDSDFVCGEYSLANRRHKIFEVLAETTRASSSEKRYQKFKDELGRGKTYADLGADCLFDPFINATNMPAQTAFVITEDYLDHYLVEEFSIGNTIVDVRQRDTRVSIHNALDDIPLGFSAFVSGAVPGWFKVGAQTGLCKDGNSSVIRGTLCDGRTTQDTLILQDGGLYDNYGYKGAFEVFSEFNHTDSNKLLIQIDTTTNWYDQANSKGQDPSFLQMARGASFPNQDATFVKTFDILAENSSIQPIVLDLFSAARFDEASHDGLLDGLDELVEYAHDPKLVIPYGNDAKRNNFWRVGMLYKTRFDFRYDSETQAGSEIPMVQLGILSVRLNAQKIRCSVYEIECTNEKD